MWTNIIMTLAQRAPWEDSPAPQPTQAPSPRMSFSDLQKGMQQWQDGTLDSNLRDGLLCVVAVILVAILIINIRQKIKARPTEDSEKRLAREIAKVIPFPLGSRQMLRWVAHTTHISAASLMLSSELFDMAVNAWAEEPTFVVIRRWGYGRLMKLREVIFD